MSEQKNAFDFADLEEGGLDIDAIFGGGAPKTENPFATQAPQQPAPKPAATPAAPTAPVSPPAAPKEQATPELPSDVYEAENPIVTAFGAQEETASAQAAQSLFEKLPVFSYGGATEGIEDTSMTFEELRIAKADDFPELSEGKKVTWTVEYGKVTKSIADPAGKSIASVKSEIEESKAFLDGLKKAKEKDRSPDCLVKPKVTAQSKGIASYKGVFATVEEARVSDKVICLIPARDGRVYEMRRNELGEFIAPASSVVDFSQMRAGFTPALPLIPFTLVQKIISFFRFYMHEYEEFEALAHIYWDRAQEEYTVFIPKQEVYRAKVDADLRGDALPEERYLHYADIHSHNSMAAKFSAMDDQDEKATRLYFVVGRLDRFCPTITARVSCGGSYQEIDPATVLEGMEQVFPDAWLENVTRGDCMSNVAPCGSGRYISDTFVPGVTL